MEAPQNLGITTWDATRLVQASIARNERRYMGSLVKVIAIFGMATAAFGGTLYATLSNVDRFTPMKDVFTKLNWAAAAALVTTLVGVLMLNPFEKITSSFDGGAEVLRELESPAPQLTSKQLDLVLNIAGDDEQLLNALYAKMNDAQKAIAKQKYPQLP